MKTKILTTVAALCCAIVLHAQEDRPYQSFFGKESTVWHGTTVNYDQPVSNYILKTVSDTTINGVVYKKIECLSIAWQTVYHEWRMPAYDFCMREDTTTGRLWFRLPNHDRDFLMADMSLTLGDTVWLRDYDTPSLDSIKMAKYIVQDTTTRDGIYTVILKDTLTETTVRFLEGVGCSNLFDQVEGDILGSSISCCHHDDLLVYHYKGTNGTEEDCIIREVGIDRCEENAAVRIIPNPFNSYFRISSSVPIVSAVLYDMKGNMVMSDIPANSDISTDKMPRGAYVLYVVSANSISQKTIIKQ